MKTRLLLLSALTVMAAAAAGQDVLITEFKAQNNGPLRDENGVTTDWIELFNASATNVNLGGWYLTDNPTNLTQWAFPSTNLDAGSFLIIFASQKNRRIPGSNLHTSFSLRGSGDYLALVRPDGVTIAQEFAPLFPPQNDWLSYGLAMDGLTVRDGAPVFLTPSPGVANPPPGPPPPLVLTEIMFNPLPAAGQAEGDPYEFIELMNAGPDPLNLGGCFFIAGVNFSFWDQTLAPGQRVMLVHDFQAFRSRHGTSLPVFGEWGGSLSDAGERLSFISSNGAVIFDFTYDDSWHRLADGRGFSLVPVNEAGPPAAYGRRQTWRSSGQTNGSPWAADAPSSVPPIYINEALSRPAPPFEDAVELFNPNPFDVDISGWHLTDDFDEPSKFTMPAGAVVPAGGFLALDEHAFNGPNEDPLAVGFGLGDFGEELYLFSTDTNGGLSGFVHGFEFGAAEPNVTFGRYVTSTGGDHFVPQTAITFLAPNAGPRLAPVVFTEIRPHPAGVASAAGRTDAFIELRNVSAQPVPLFDPRFPTNTWRLRDAGLSATAFDFPGGTVLPPGGYALVVGFNPTNAALLAQFAAVNRVPPGVSVFGPWPGFLGDDGALELLRPDAPQPLFVPYLLVERLDYSTAPPWPTTARGDCLSLHRAAELAYGNDPTNWVAGQLTPGMSAGLPPSLIPPLLDQKAHVASAAVFDVTATGGTPTYYQWHFNGAAIPGANVGALQFENVQPGHAGFYSCYVSNAQVAGLTCVALLEVFDTNRPALIVTAPAGVRARANVAAFTFAGTALDDGPLAAVFVQLGESAPVPAAGLANWSASLELQPGLNTLRVFALDWASNASATSAVAVVLAPDPVRLSLLLSGAGTVIGATNRQPLRVGRRYRIRAAPVPGHNFSHWLDWETGLVVTNPTYTFTMSSNRTLAAQFSPGPFAGLVGGYNGLFQSPASPAHLGAGFFTLRVAASGAYSGRVYYGGARHALHGRFSESLVATQTVNRSGPNDLHLSLRLSRDPVRVSGTVAEDRFSSPLDGHRSGFSPGSTATNLVGRYFASLNSLVSATNTTSTAVFNVNRAGLVAVRGRLPDRTPVAANFLAGDDGRVPCYQLLYRNAGSTFGWLSLANGTANPLQGSMVWTRNGARGFTNQIEVLGHR